VKIRRPVYNWYIQWMQQSVCLKSKEVTWISLNARCIFDIFHKNKLYLQTKVKIGSNLSKQKINICNRHSQQSRNVTHIPHHFRPQIHLKTGSNKFLFLHNYIQFSTLIRKKCFEKIFVGI